MAASDASPYNRWLASDKTGSHATSAILSIFYIAGWSSPSRDAVTVARRWVTAAQQVPRVWQRQMDPCGAFTSTPAAFCGQLASPGVN